MAVGQPDFERVLLIHVTNDGRLENDAAIAGWNIAGVELQDHRNARCCETLLKKP